MPSARALYSVQEYDITSTCLMEAVERHMLT